MQGTQKMLGIEVVKYWVMKGSLRCESRNLRLPNRRAADT